ncbi:hypothetical protein BOX08_gp28 [Pseudoalteromonas phage BS5]|uniref:hypothetical protein n=1 Tax=Pseudoalteromonas phage BS5 TaxID=1874539 RepID=UPI000819A3DD|nr:hypothetical protein BOX08_gp28 [Pseudoalteromonas phage BS5]ANY29593.1 hypothetical protein [Pseudoalteromonas phage BS5]
MDAQQLHDYIIKPTLQCMGGGYYSKESAFLLLCTAAIESNCGQYIKQINGPALGIWQMEPDTHSDIWQNCDVLNDCDDFRDFIGGLQVLEGNAGGFNNLIDSPKYACAMARLKYSMDPNPLPKLTGNSSADLKSFYDYYKRVYNTELGASTYDKWCIALDSNGVMEVKL